MTSKRIGRKGKYEDWITDSGLLRIEGWARDGMTDAMICQKIGISVGTICEWKNRFPEIDEALKKGKAPVDIQVENALLKRALGYDYEETITEIVEEEDGKKRKHVKKTKRHVPPDTVAQIFWLKNRRPDKWRDKIEQSVNIIPEETRTAVQEMIYAGINAEDSSTSSD